MFNLNSKSFFAKYSFEILNNILVIEDRSWDDLDKNYKSVTNCMEEILEEISKIKSINLNFFKIIYSDTFGLWSEVVYDEKLTFSYLGASRININDNVLIYDKNEAIKEIEKKYCLNDGIIKW